MFYRPQVVKAQLLRQSWTYWRDYWEVSIHRQTKVSLSPSLPPSLPSFCLSFTLTITHLLFSLLLIYIYI